MSFTALAMSRFSGVTESSGIARPQPTALCGARREAACP